MTGRSVTSGADEPAGVRHRVRLAIPTSESFDCSTLDECLADSDWPVVHRLLRLGVGSDGVYALLRLRTAVRQRGGPAMDGFAADPRARFAR